MKTKKNSWTKEEDDRLIAIISENDCHLQKSFRMFNQEYPNRSISAISVRWYNKLRTDNNTKVCFVTVTQKQDESKVSLWKRLLNSIFKLNN